MGIDLRKYMSEENQEECEHTKEVASKFGIQVVCDEEDLEEDLLPTLHLQESEECEHSKVTASKLGIKIVCDETED